MVEKLVTVGYHLTVCFLNQVLPTTKVQGGLEKLTPNSSRFIVLSMDAITLVASLIDFLRLYKGD